MVCKYAVFRVCIDSFSGSVMGKQSKVLQIKKIQLKTNNKKCC